VTAARFTSPVGHDLPKPAMSPAKLEAAIATARARVEAHKASRPGHTDIPALTAWAQAHDLLRFDLELLLGQRPARDVPTPTIPPPARPAPTMEIPVNEHELKVQDLLAEIKAYTARAASAIDRAAFRQIYQKVNNLRHKARGIAKAHDLAEPVFPPLPVNPFAEQVPMPTQAPTPTVDTVLDQHLPALELPEEGEIAEAGIRGPVEQLEKAGPGPYVEPTAEVIRALLPPQDAARISAEWMAVKVQPSEALQEHLAQFIADARALLPAWVPLVQAELLRARAKFPGSEHRTLALMEEAGEVVKAALDLHNRKPGATREALHAEIIQTMAMCVRLYEEGDPGVLGEGAA
jgi:hypothetical protein